MIITTNWKKPLLPPCLPLAASAPPNIANDDNDVKADHESGDDEGVSVDKNDIDIDKNNTMITICLTSSASSLVTGDSRRISF